MKKFACHALGIVLAMGVAACGGGQPSDTGTARTASAGAVTAAAPAVTAAAIKLGKYPDYNPNPPAPDTAGVQHSASELAGRIGIGWNIGNTLEAIGGETNWGNPKISRELIRLVKQSGFNAIRLPTSWDQYADPQTGKISDAWLNRVREVVQYCVDNDMYVIVNIHWDGGWLENNVDLARKSAVNAKQKAYWQQIATALRDFDEHLLFAGANEPDVADAKEMEILMGYHQTFVDTVRATGGRNAYRVLVVQGPKTDIGRTDSLMWRLPADTVPGRLMVEVHFYDPYNFTLMQQDESWGNQFYYWGNGYHSTTDTAHNATWGEETHLGSNFALMKQKFVDRGVPVVLGEFAAMKRSKLTGDDLALHLASRAYYHNVVVRTAIANGMLPFFWDTGAQDASASGIFDRNTNTVRDRQMLDALVGGAQ